MLFRRVMIVILSCVFCVCVFAEEECPIGYGPTKYVTTKNLFDFTQLFSLRNSLYVQETDGTIRVLELDYASWTSVYTLGYIVLEPGEYVISSTEPGVRMEWADEYGQNLKEGNLPMAITLTEPRKFTCKFFKTGQTPPYNVGKIQLEQGTIATPYIHYGYGYITRLVGNCAPCPPNTYKDFVGYDACTPCPDTLFSASGSTSIEDCGRLLHVGDYVAYMPYGKHTEHGLCTMLDGKKYCADMYEKQ